MQQIQHRNQACLCSETSYDLVAPTCGSYVFDNSIIISDFFFLNYHFLLLIQIFRTQQLSVFPRNAQVNSCFLCQLSEIVYWVYRQHAHVHSTFFGSARKKQKHYSFELYFLFSCGRLILPRRYWLVSAGSGFTIHYKAELRIASFALKFLTVNVFIVSTVEIRIFSSQGTWVHFHRVDGFNQEFFAENYVHQNIIFFFCALN